MYPRVHSEPCKSSPSRALAFGPVVALVATVTGRALVLMTMFARVASADATVRGQAAFEIEPAAPIVERAGSQGVFAGYRIDARGENILHGIAFHGLWGRPSSPFELELMTAFGWGTTGAGVDARRLGQAQFSAGLRYVVNKHADTRAFAVVAPVLAVSRFEGEAMRVGVGAEVGLGVQRSLRFPGAVAFDVRVARTRDLADGAMGPWNAFATLSIGLYLPRLDGTDGTQYAIPVVAR